MFIASGIIDTREVDVIDALGEAGFILDSRTNRAMGRARGKKAQGARIRR